MKVTLCVPSRQRQSRILEFLESVRNTVVYKQNVEIALYIDKGDNETDEKAILDAFPDLNILAFRRRRVDGSKRYNILAKETTGDILGYFADDILFLNKGWDINLFDTFNKHKDRIFLFSPVDPECADPDGKKATHGFVSRKSVELLGYFFPPGFKEYWHDQWLTEIYKEVGRFVVCRNINVRHNSYRINPALYDEVYARMNTIVKGGGTLIKAMKNLYYSDEKVIARNDSVKILKSHIDSCKNERS